MTTQNTRPEMTADEKGNLMMTIWSQTFSGRDSWHVGYRNLSELVAEMSDDELNRAFWSVYTMCPNSIALALVGELAEAAYERGLITRDVVDTLMF